MLRIESRKQTDSSRQRPASHSFRAGLLAAVAFGGLVAGPLEAFTNMKLKKDASPEPVAIGNPITYTINVDCNGSEDAEDPTMTDTLPAGVTFVSATGTGWTCGHAAGVVTCTWDAGTFPKGTDSDITIVVTAPGIPTAPGSPLVNYAIVVPTNLDPSEQNNDDTASTNVVAPGFTVTPTSGLVTTEAGGTDTFDVVLLAPPAPGKTVTVHTLSDDLTEGTSAPADLDFTEADWNIAQTVTVTGVDDILTDGDIVYNIVNTFSTDGDVAYDALDADTAVDDVEVTNTDDLSEGTFYTLAPCRVVDTRNGDGVFTDGEIRTYPVSTELSACGFTSTTARALSLNITVAEASGAGEFNLYADGVTTLGSTVLPFNSGNNRANNAIVAISALGEFVAEASLTSGSAHLIIDINGYFE